VCTQYLSHIYGKRHARDISRTIEICKAVACSESNINYTVLMMLRNKRLSHAMPQVMMCSMIDPIQVFELPRMVYNIILNSVSLPIFFAISVFQREMEIPTLPLESVIEFFTNGSKAGCCVRAGVPARSSAASAAGGGSSNSTCPLGSNCHTRRIRDMLIRMLERRAFLPKESGMLMRYDTNCLPYITGYGNEADKADMSMHMTLGRIRTSSCLRGPPPSGTAAAAAGGRGGRRTAAGNAQQQDQQDNEMRSRAGGESPVVLRIDAWTCLDTPCTGLEQWEEVSDVCRMFGKMCFQHYGKPFSECAMIMEHEFIHAMHEFMIMNTKFAQIFGDLPYFGQHAAVMQNLGVPNIPACFQNYTRKQVFEQGMPILNAKTYISGEVGLGIDWMCMLLMLAMSGSSRYQMAADV